MGTPELYISACCCKITKCTNKEAQALSSKDNRIYFATTTDELLDGYLIEYPAIKMWRTELSDRYTNYAEVRNNPLAIKAFKYTKENNSKVHSSTGVSK